MTATCITLVKPKSRPRGRQSVCQQRALCWSSPKSTARGRGCDSNVHYAGQALRVRLEAASLVNCLCYVSSSVVHW